MSLFALPDSDSEYTLVNNTISSLARATKVLTPQADLASKLAVMLVAESRYQEAVELLDSVIKYAKYGGNESRWGSFGNCIVIRSHLARELGEVGLSDRLMADIAENEIMAVERGRNLLAKECLEDHYGEMSVAAAEAPTHAIDVLAGRICDYLYFVESHNSIYNDLPTDVTDRFYEAFGECIAAVKERLS